MSPWVPLPFFFLCPSGYPRSILSALKAGRVSVSAGTATVIMPFYQKSKGLPTSPKLTSACISLARLVPPAASDYHGVIITILERY